MTDQSAPAGASPDLSDLRLHFAFVDNGRTVFVLHPEGDDPSHWTVDLGEAVTWTEAARAFWNAVFMVAHRPSPFPSVAGATQ